MALRSHVSAHSIGGDLDTLVVGGSDDDVDVLRRVGFNNITVSDLSDAATSGGFSATGVRRMAIDVEQMDSADESYDLVFAHEVLHHCRSPHKALCEMLRVARRYVLFLEPNDSLLMRSLVAMRMSFPYELPAVIHHGGVAGGVRHSQIPNYIFRWSHREVVKTVSSFIPERLFAVSSRPYWDFNVDEYEISLRRITRIGLITTVIGARNFVRLLHRLGAILNLIPILRRQGNKFFCVVEKQTDLHPWLSRKNGKIVFVGGSIRERPED